VRGLGTQPEHGLVLIRGASRASDALVVAQGAAGAALLWPGRACWSLPSAVRRAAQLAVVAGGALGVAGARSLGRDLTPFVDPRPEAVLRTTGPFRVSRNPVYTGLLVAVGGVAVLRRRPEPLVAAAGLAAVLHVKAGVEERRLTARFGPAYQEYAAATPRLLGLPAAVRLRSRRPARRTGGVSGRG